jgi:putative flavoprotein involved in K+ transport
MSPLEWREEAEKVMTLFDTISTGRLQALGGPIEEGAALLEIAGLGSAPTLRPNRKIEPTTKPERVRVAVIGAGQAGLSVGYHLAQRSIPFVILDANQRVGDPWRQRWDSLRLFTPARYDGLDGLRFPAPTWSFPTKDEMADYLEAYARHFKLPVRSGVRVDRVTRQGNRFVLSAGVRRFEADEVVVAMSSYQTARPPDFANALAPSIVQLHSSKYRNPAQLGEGSVLVVGFGNSGAEIAIELARHGRQVVLAGHKTSEVPFRMTGALARTVLVPLLFRVVFHRVLSSSTPIGRRVRLKGRHSPAPLIRVKERDLVAAGIKPMPRVVGVGNGLPELADGQVLPVDNVIWCTGFRTDFDWIDLPVFDQHGDPVHRRGEVDAAPGLYFVGLQFLHALSSAMIQGVGRDAAYVATRIAQRVLQAS